MGLANQIHTVQFTAAGSNSIDDVTETYDYDGAGRISTKTKTVKGITYTNSYLYNDYGEVTTYTYPSNLKITHEYVKGYLKKVKHITQSGSQTLFDGYTQNGRGQYTAYKLGNCPTSTNTYYHGYLTNLATPGIQDYELDYDFTTGNIVQRTDNIKQNHETFGYDNLNRLISIQLYNNSGTPTIPIQSITYDLNGFGNCSRGNIATKYDVGDYGYTNRLHQASFVTNTPQSISLSQQDITYTPFMKTNTVKEDNFIETFKYDADEQRVSTTVADINNGNATIYSRIYIDDYEETKDATGNTQYKVHYIEGGDGLCTICVDDVANNTRSFYCVFKDHLGSLLTLTDLNGTVVAEQNFDAWGRRRDPQTWLYANVPTPPDWLYRGFTGHEHMPEFTLINMNARMYDPILGRMLAPDKYIMPLGTQGYNRYSYCGNNPLKYTDPSGYVFGIDDVLIAMAISAISYTASVAASPGGLNNWNIMDFSKSVITGAIMSVWSYGIGQAFGPTGSALNELGRATAHGALSYICSDGSNGSFMAGFAGSAWSSITSNIPVLNTGVGGGISASFVGGAAENMSGGDFIHGAGIGLMGYMFNQAAHKLERPDKDGYITLEEANYWYKHGRGKPLYANFQGAAGEIPYGLFSYPGEEKWVNTFGSSESGTVYGTIKVRYLGNHRAESATGYDIYDFDQQKGRPFRNAFTKLGSWVAGQGTQYRIYFYGQATLIYPSSIYYPSTLFKH